MEIICTVSPHQREEVTFAFTCFPPRGLQSETSSFLHSSFCLTCVVSRPRLSLSLSPLWDQCVCDVSVMCLWCSPSPLCLCVSLCYLCAILGSYPCGVSLLCPLTILTWEKCQCSSIAECDTQIKSLLKMFCCLSNLGVSLKFSAWLKS